MRATATAVVVTTGAALLLAGCLAVDAPEAGTGGTGGGGGGGRPPVGVACRSDTTCAAGERCVLGAPADCVGQDCASPGHCAPPVGAIGDLVPCAQDPDCASGSCAPNGSCRRLCEDRADCPPGFGCAALATAAGGVADSCVGEGDTLDRHLCGLAEAWSCGGGQRCALVYDRDRAQNWSASCVADDPGLLADLTPCLRNDQCRGGHCAEDGCSGSSKCPDDLHGCSSPCRTDADCAFPAYCESTGDGISRCELECLDRRGCPLDQLCGVEATDGGWRATCADQPTLLGTGAPCEADDACASGLCVVGDASGGRLCSELCNPQDGAASCAANGLASLSCIAVRDDGGEPHRAVRACGWP